MPLLRSRKTELTVSNRTILRVLGLVLGSLILLAAVRRAAHALILIFTAFFLALALNHPVHWLAAHLPGRRRGNRTLATAASFLTVVILIGAFLASVVPPLVQQTGSFVQQAPQFVSSVRDENSSLGRVVRRYGLQDDLNRFSSQLSERLRSATGSAVSVVSRIAGSVLSTLTILVLTFMMLVEGPRWLQLLRRLLPLEQRAHADQLANQMYGVVKGFVNGQVILAALAALLIVPALFILGISYPFALALVVFLAGLIPLVGHTLGAIIITSVALFHSPLSAAIILGYYILYQQIENYLLQPRIQANSTNLSPLLVFMSVVIGVSFGGLFGGLVAIPLAGCLRVILVDYLRRRGKLSGGDAAVVG